MLDTAELKKNRLYLGKIETEFKNSVDRLSAAHSLYLRCSSHAIRTLHSLTVLTIIILQCSRLLSFGKTISLFRIQHKSVGGWVWCSFGQGYLSTALSSLFPIPMSLWPRLSIYCTLQPVFLFTSLWPRLYLSTALCSLFSYSHEPVAVYTDFPKDFCQGREILQ